MSAASHDADFQLLFEAAPGSFLVLKPDFTIVAASDASQSFQRDLVKGSNGVAYNCQMERILVHGRQPLPADNPEGFTGFAFSSCSGYGSGAGSGGGI